MIGDVIKSNVVLKYRKLPVIIAAIQWDGKNTDAVLDFIGLTQADVKGNYMLSPVDSESYMSIHTLEGDMKANVYDFIIKGIKGEFYPCKPEIFTKSYEPIG